MNLLIACLYFLMSLFSDTLAVFWHQARENRRALDAANLGALMAALAWLPLVLLITQGNWLIIIADIAGGWAGSYLAIRKLSE